MKQFLLMLFLGCFWGGKSQNLYFPPTVGSAWDTLAPATLGYCQPEIGIKQEIIHEQPVPRD
ncbi:MAG: hypothetical protein FJZ80_10045 [Bacteroidetes bacterium]|nr:hypothetical protein [Bacteroidota bacterium]MBM3425302.1 hypothetical protein [Bacteroidota bacterium]